MGTSQKSYKASRKSCKIFTKQKSCKDISQGRYPQIVNYQLVNFP